MYCPLAVMFTRSQQLAEAVPTALASAVLRFLSAVQKHTLCDLANKSQVSGYPGPHGCHGCSKNSRQLDGILCPASRGEAALLNC